MPSSSCRRRRAIVVVPSSSCRRCRPVVVVIRRRSADLQVGLAWHSTCRRRGMHTNRPHRLRTFNYIGCHRYSLTFCTNFRARRFVDRDVVELVLSQFLRAADEQKFSVLAYCFMPDHVHFLVQGNAESSDGRRLIRLGKQYAGYAYSAKYAQKLWQPWGFERVLRDDEPSFVAARYIIENPIRAGLAHTVFDYPFVGSQVYQLKDLVASLPT